MDHSGKRKGAWRTEALRGKCGHCSTLMNLTVVRGTESEGIERWLIALLGGKRVTVKMADIGPSGDLNTEVAQRETTTAMLLKGTNKAMIEARNLNHSHAAPWCGIGSSNAWRTRQRSTQYADAISVHIGHVALVSPVLTMADRVTDHVGLSVVSQNSPDKFAWRELREHIRVCRQQRAF